jgi:hypothetical protein
MRTIEDAMAEAVEAVSRLDEFTAWRMRHEAITRELARQEQWRAEAPGVLCLECLDTGDDCPEECRP